AHSAAGSRAVSQAMRTVGPPTARAAGSADDCDRARGARWCRAGSSPAPLRSGEAQPLRGPLPGPLAALDRGIHPFDDGRAAPSGGLPVGTDGETHATSFDHDGLARFCRIENARKVLTRLCRRVTLHECTMYTSERTCSKNALMSTGSTEPPALRRA